MRVSASVKASRQGGRAGASEASGGLCGSAWRGERAASDGACGADRVAGQPENAGPAQPAVRRSPSRRRWRRTCRRGSARVLGLKRRSKLSLVAQAASCMTTVWPRRRGRRRGASRRARGRGAGSSRRLRAHCSRASVALVADWRALCSCDEPRQPCFAFASAFVAAAAYNNATPRPIQPSPRSAIGTSKSRSLTVSSAAPAIRSGKAARPIASGSDS